MMKSKSSSFLTQNFQDWVWIDAEISAAFKKESKENMQQGDQALAYN